MARPRTTEPKRPDDARAHRSVEALRSALLDLIERKSFDQISIKDISEAAGLSYPTFFRRFASKEALLEDIATEEVRKLLSLGETIRDTRETGYSAIETCSYVAAHRRLWTTLLTGGAAGVMRQEFIRVSTETMRTKPRLNPWLPADLGPPFVTAGLFELLAWWMRQPEDYPVENVIALFNALIIDNVVRQRSVELA
ncbi:MAG TPA: helix-turn-helix domain-containing protein [Sphingomicrobium sp.]